MVTKSLKEILSLPPKTVLAQVKGKVCAVNKYDTGENAGGPFSVQEIMIEDDGCTLLCRIGHHPEIKKDMIGQNIALISAKKPTGQLVGVKTETMDLEDEGEMKTIKYLSVSKSAEIIPLTESEPEPEPEVEEEAPKVEPKKQEVKKSEPVREAVKMTPLNITEIRFDRTVNTGNYCNQRIGVTVDIAKGEDPEAAMEAAKAWVDKQAPKEVRG